MFSPDIEQRTYTHHCRVLFQNSLEELRRLAQFLEKDHLPSNVLSRIADHCSFDSMRTNPMTNHLDVYSINSHISPLLRKGHQRGIVMMI